MKSALRTFLRWGLFARWMTSAVAVRTTPGPVLTAVCRVPGSSLVPRLLMAGPAGTSPAITTPEKASPAMTGPAVASPAGASSMVKSCVVDGSAGPDPAVDSPAGPDYASAELRLGYARHHRKLPSAPVPPEGETCS